MTFFSNLIRKIGSCCMFINFACMQKLFSIQNKIIILIVIGQLPQKKLGDSLTWTLRTNVAPSKFLIKPWNAQVCCYVYFTFQKFWKEQSPRHWKFLFFLGYHCSYIPFLSQFPNVIPVVLQSVPWKLHSFPNSSNNFHMLPSLSFPFSSTISTYE